MIRKTTLALLALALISSITAGYLILRPDPVNESERYRDDVTILGHQRVRIDSLRGANAFFIGVSMSVIQRSAIPLHAGRRTLVAGFAMQRSRALRSSSSVAPAFTFARSRTRSSSHPGSTRHDALNSSSISRRCRRTSFDAGAKRSTASARTWDERNSFVPSRPRCSPVPE